MGGWSGWRLRRGGNSQEGEEDGGRKKRKGKNLTFRGQPLYLPLIFWQEIGLKDAAAESNFAA